MWWIWCAVLLCGVGLIGAPAALAAPKLDVVDPKDAGTETPINQTMMWKVTSGDEDVSSLYAFLVRWGATPNLENASGNLPYPLFAPGTLAPKTTYYWRVEATSVPGAGLPPLVGGVWRFTTAAEATPVLTPLDPADAATDVAAPTKTVLWSVLRGTEDLSSQYTYEVRWGTSAALERSQRGLTAPAGTLTGLLRKTAYYWRVVATPRAGGNAIFGPIWRFTTAAEATPVLTPLDPTDAATDVAAPTKTVLWSVLRGTEDLSFQYTYEVRWGTSAALERSQRGLTAPAGTLTGLLRKTAYYWRVVATPRAGGNAISGPIWRFTTAAAQDLVLTFENIEPGEGEKDLRPDLSLRWDCTMGSLSVGGLRFAVRLSTTPSNLVTVASNLADKLFHPTTLTYEKTYYWQIIASGVDEDGAPVEWQGPIWKFTTGPERGEDAPLDGGGGCALGMGTPLEGLLLLAPFLTLLAR